MSAGVSVTGLAIASMYLIPNYKLLTQLAGGIPVWILSILYLLLQGYSLLDQPIAVDLAVVMGGLLGGIYIMLLKRGQDLGKWMHQLLHLLNNSLAPKN